jgi:hypothetical protein
MIVFRCPGSLCLNDWKIKLEGVYITVWFIVKYIQVVLLLGCYEKIPHGSLNAHCSCPVHSCRKGCFRQVWGGENRSISYVQIQELVGWCREEVGPAHPRGGQTVNRYLPSTHFHCSSPISSIHGTIRSENIRHWFSWPIAVKVMFPAFHKQE